MFKSIFKYLFFVVPIMFLCGLVLIIFENKDVTTFELEYRTRKRTDRKRKQKAVLLEYLKNCYKQVNKDNKGNEQA